MVADAGVGLVDGGGQALQRGDVAAVMAFILGSSSCYEIVECSHLSSDVLHLGIDYADRLFVDRLGGRLN